MRRAVALIVLAAALAAAAPAAALEGALVQPASPGGCVSDTGSGGLCADGVELAYPSETVLSPNGQRLYVSASQSDAIVVFDRDPLTGALTQKAGVAGCVSETGSSGACADGRGLDFLDGLAISPDGANLYATGQFSDAVAVFDVDAATGVLTQKAGIAGCVSETGSGGACADGLALVGATGVAVSPGGETVYVASFTSAAVAIFDRGPGGTLTQKPGTAGCISEDGTGGACQDGRGLSGLYPGLLATSDGKSVYAPSLLNDAIARFDRAPDGTLSQPGGQAGCVQDTGLDGCADGVALGRPNFLLESPDGEHVYAANSTSSAVAVFDRAPDGALTQKPGLAGCVSDSGSAGACTDGNALGDAVGLGMSPDGGTLYVGALASDAIAVFDIDPATGALTQLAGTAGCVADSGLGGLCATVTGVAGTRGRISVSSDGAFVYAAGAEADSVTIFRRTPNARPTCAPVTAATAFAQPVAVTLACSDPDGDALTRVIDGGPANGSLGTIDATGSVAYSPAAGFSGTDGFTFRAQDAGGPGAAASASITVGAAPAPVTPPAPAPAPKPIPAPTPLPRSVPITSIATLPSTKACVSRRRFRIRLRGVKAGKIVRAQIKLNGAVTRTVRGAALGLPIDLRGLPKGRFLVEIITTDRAGKRLVGKRRYRTCVPRTRSVR